MGTILKWEEFQTLVGLKEKSRSYKKLSAIYMWGWMQNDGTFLSYYVGKTYNLYERLFRHIGCLNGGLYTVYHKDYILNGHFIPLKEPDGERLLYVPSDLATFVSYAFWKNEIIQDNLKWLIENMVFSWAETNAADNAELEKHVARKIESSGRQIGTTIRGTPSISEVVWTGNYEILKLIGQT
jgi:hypothetical protein